MDGVYPQFAFFTAEGGMDCFSSGSSPVSDQELEVKTVSAQGPAEDSFAAGRRALMKLLENASRLSRGTAEICAELEEKLRSNIFNLVVVGQFKRGKTYLINALIGKPLLPVAVVPLTSIVTVLAYGEETRVRVYFNDGTRKAIELEDLPQYVTEFGNPKNAKDVRDVLISYPSSYLEGGVRLIDTPGVGSIYVHNTDVAYQYLPRCDAALFLLSVAQPVSQAEIDFLRDVQEFSHKIFFLLNKIDHLTEDETRESIAFSKNALEQAMGGDVRLFPVSAKLALQGKLDASHELLRRSGLPDFSDVLHHFLVNEKGKVLLDSAGRTLLRSLSQERFQVELEQQSLTAPLEELEAKLELFESRRRQILAERESFAILLDGELKRFVKDVLDKDLARFKGDLAQSMEGGFDSFYEEHRDLSLKELNDALENYVISEVEKAFADWRRLEEEKIGEAFEKICNGYAARINGILDELLKFSSELFDVPLQIVHAESFWARNLDFYFKMKQEPVGLDMLTDSVTQVLPGFIMKRFAKFRTYMFGLANRVILNKRRRHMLETIDVQAGRTRFDFVNRLEKGKAHFQREVLRRVDATVDAVAQAVEQGKRERERGEEEVRVRSRFLEERIENIKDMERKVQEIIS